MKGIYAEVIDMYYKLPNYIIYILNTLVSSGFEAYLVGGCVRDMLMGKAPNDYDITTSARPDEVIALFKRTVSTGERFGTVTVLYGKGKAEVTTYRSEGDYSDSRRPDGVSFVSDLKEDLSRRDFTVNAMVMDMSGNIVDLFGGREDIDSRILRTVGDSEKRFSEDALRMMRAVRFSAQLGFEINNDALNAIKKLAVKCEALSTERVRAELYKTLMSDSPDKVSLFIQYGMLSKYTESGKKCDFSALIRVKSHILHRLSAFCALLADNMLISSVYDFLIALGLSEKRAKQIDTAVSISNCDYNSDFAIRKLLYTYGKDTVLLALSARKALRKSYPIPGVMQILRSGACLSKDKLTLSPSDLISLGITGADIGRCQAYLMEEVIKNPEKNKKDILLEILREGGYYI